MLSKWVISPTYKWGSPWGYNPLIRSPLILTSWDIQVGGPPRALTRKKSNTFPIQDVVSLPHWDSLNLCFCHSQKSRFFWGINKKKNTFNRESL